MKLAVIADVHSNLQALEAVLADIKSSGTEQILCAGDIIGYGANPNECCDLVRGATRLAVFGNHELATLTGDTIWMNKMAAEAAVWTSNTLDQRSRAYLEQLEIAARLEVSGRTIMMYHGSVDSAIEYVYEEEVSSDLLKRASADILILGHTHVPYVVRFEHGLVVNPGSVGQPRDRDTRASYAFVDPVHMTCELRRVRYKVEDAAESISAAGLPHFLAERLLMGR